MKGLCTAHCRCITVHSFPLLALTFALFFEFNHPLCQTNYYSGNEQIVKSRVQTSGLTSRLYKHTTSILTHLVNYNSISGIVK